MNVLSFKSSLIAISILELFKFVLGFLGSLCKYFALVLLLASTLFVKDSEFVFFDSFLSFLRILSANCFKFCFGFKLGLVRLIMDVG